MDCIILEAKKIHKKYRRINSDGSISMQTKSAIQITKKWQERVSEIVSTSGIEVDVTPDEVNKERIDVIDFSTNTAYELKVSGKNAHHEFYKDLVKVIVYNEYSDEREKQDVISRFVFITEQFGIDALNRRITDKLLKLLKNKHGLEIVLIGIENKSNDE